MAALKPQEYQHHDRSSLRRTIVDIILPDRQVYDNAASD